jgi:uncharacterized protein (DUF58 family)
MIESAQTHILSHLELFARQVVEGFITGLHKSPFHGFSVEFAEHRLYNTGEPTRHIDWKLYARTDKLFVKRYEEETNLRCQLVIDNSSSMHYPPAEKNKKEVQNKITFSVYAAASLMYLLKMQRDATGLTVFTDKIDVHTPARSTAIHQKLMMHKLEEIMNENRQPLRTHAAAALHELAENLHRRSMVIIFSDMFENVSDTENLFDALKHLRYNKHEVILFHVTDKRLEENFEFENRPYRFVDVETGEEVKVHSHLVREAYMQSMQSFKKELMLRCAQYRIEFVPADIHEGFNHVLMTYLVKRSKLY